MRSFEVKAVVFDVGGVLRNEIVPVMQRYLKTALQIDRDSCIQAWNMLYPQYSVGKIKGREFFQKMHLHTASTMTDYPSEETIEMHIMKKFRKKRQVLKLVNDLEKRGFVLGIASNISPVLRKVDASQGLYNSFSFQLFSYEIGIRKPDAEFYLAIQDRLRKHGVIPKQTLFIDNRQNNIEVAAAIGMQSLLFSGVRQLRRDLAQRGLIKPI